ncbi:MAG: SUMF1/EgtB/PvdO family nonheme iron enzyme [Verrucomicrobiales bacterium]
MLRCIGRGSYGEVWMARAVTGALRAVKVVRRKDFEMERTFEREFEGIRSFEPISRNHPGLIDILHVGRNQEEGFYYCVMELADDRYRGRQISPADYEPRTLGTDKRDGERLDLDKITEVGLLVAEGLAHLHAHGLIHRDVKPSNIIFVNGVAQLADIGLVAAYGQRTYVGTEGFVPPEGPGTPQADTYSLGMVLYELTTRKDRLEFPAVPDDISLLGDRKKWRALNEVICRACAPVPKQRYASADEMADDLRRVLLGKTRKRGLLGRKRTWAVAAALLLFAASQAHQRQRATELDLHTGPSVAPTRPVQQLEPAPALPTAPPKVGTLIVSGHPDGAEVFVGGQKRGTLPLELKDLPAGKITVEVKAPRHRDFLTEQLISPDQPVTVPAKLDFWNPPVIGQPWSNSLGMSFQPRGLEHVSTLPATRDQYVRAHDGRFEDGEVLPWTAPDGGEVHFIVFVPNPEADFFRHWVEVQDHEKGCSNADYYYRLEKVEAGISPMLDDKTKDNLAFRLVIGLKQFGEVRIESEPPGAEIFGEGKRLGTTPFEIPHHLTGPVKFELRLPGYNSETVTGTVEPGQALTLKKPLTRSLLAVFDQEWQNSLGMMFRPVDDVQFCIWETRVKDYDAYLAATKQRHEADLDQAPDHPVINVSRDDAVAFCRWLTQKERREGRLDKNWEYRLPTDIEWSRAAGIPSERGGTPSERHVRIKGVFVWGYVWPPPAAAGNFADQSAIARAGLNKPPHKLLPLNDGFTFTAPVGAFAPTQNGIFDLAGNVSEWVAEDFGGNTGNSNYQNYGVLRGASWADSDKEELLTSFRSAVYTNFHNSTAGFRVVLAR